MMNGKVFNCPNFKIERETAHSVIKAAIIATAFKTETLAETDLVSILVQGQLVAQEYTLGESSTNSARKFNVLLRLRNIQKIP